MIFLQLFRRLNSEPMTEAVEDQLLIMKSHLVKIKKYRLTSDAKPGSIVPVNGKLELSSLKHRINYNSIVLCPETKGELGMASYKKIDRRTSENSATFASMNQEWRTMFAAQDNPQVTCFVAKMILKKFFTRHLLNLFE